MLDFTGGPELQRARVLAGLRPGPGLGIRASGLAGPSCALSCTVRPHMAHGARAVLGIEVRGSGWVLPHARVLADTGIMITINQSGSCCRVLRLSGTCRLAVQVVKRELEVR